LSLLLLFIFHRVNWKENETGLIQTYYSYLKDVPNSFLPTATQLHTAYESRLLLPKDSTSHLTPPNPEDNKNVPFQLTGQNWISMHPLVVSLRSISRIGDTMTIDLYNHSENYFLKLNFVSETIPNWLLISNCHHHVLDDIISPHSKARFNFENDHAKSTLR
jgi:hypothetical protein